MRSHDELPCPVRRRSGIRLWPNQGRLPTFDGVVQFLGPGAGYLMCLGAVAALAGSLSSTGVMGRMTVSTDAAVLLGGLGTFVIGFMAWLA